MDATELRALADALEPMARAPRFEDFDVPAFCAWVRAQADAQPVAWRCEVRGDGSNPAWDGFGWRHYHTTTSEREALAFVARCGNGIEGRAVPLYPHPAPAAPQAEPCIGNDSACPCQDGDACHYKDSADGTKAWPVPQAEPKREPSAAEWLSTDDAETHLAAAMRDAARIAPPSDDKAILDALKRRGIWLAQIGGSDE